MPDDISAAQTADKCIVIEMRIRLLMRGFDLLHAAAAALDTITEQIELLGNAEGADDTEVTAASPAPADEAAVDPAPISPVTAALPAPANEAAVDPAPVHPVADGDNTLA